MLKINNNYFHVPNNPNEYLPNENSRQRILCRLINSKESCFGIFWVNGQMKQKLCLICNMCEEPTLVLIYEQFRAPHFSSNSTSEAAAGVSALQKM